MKPTTPNLPERESRFLSAQIELRAAADSEKPIVRGYAAKFDSRSEALGSKDYKFIEIIKPGAFDDVLNNDVRALLNHDSNLILARSKAGAGSLQIGVDATGLWYEFEAPDTQVGRDLITSLRRGDIDQSSFSFSVSQDGQTWKEERVGDGPLVITRTISKVSNLYDVSPVTVPAYSDTTVALRSLEEFRNHEPETPEPDAQTPSQEEISEVGDWAARLGLPPAQ